MKTQIWVVDVAASHRNGCMRGVVHCERKLFLDISICTYIYAVEGKASPFFVARLF
jgi:hypothetical protein